MKKIVLTGGGTAGHIYPALAIAEKLKGFEIHYFGSNGMEKEIVSKHKNIIFHEIPAVKLERKFTFKNFLIPFKLHNAVKICKEELSSLNPSVIFSKGGFVAVPVAMAGKKLHIPIISHESDLSFGLANKIILHYCTTMCTTFEKTVKNNKKCVHTGQPIRQKIFEGQNLRLFKNNNPTLLVLGGSLGAKFLNDIIFENLEKLTKKYNIIHICGKKNYQNIIHENYLILPYAENIEDYYASADFVLARAGSGVINELLCLEKPMLLIPLSKKCSRGDQIENAKLFTELGYSEMLEEENYSFEKLIEKLEKLQKNSEKIKNNMKKTAKNNAVEHIINILNKF
ncbi:MAG: undecaprenyldiphospho-muramoylpentapeptide beta-N-acetylglucosaminyltransferase [Candidatus Caccovivens sp.]